jgi:D-tyrosyl-tRNA(Tyr) deacylase
MLPRPTVAAGQAVEAGRLRALVQRVTEARVEVAGEVTGAIGSGLLVLLGVTHEDTDQDASRLAQKCRDLRCFPDDAGAMNRSLAEVGGELLVVSQFTLYGDTRKGNRPSFVRAAPAPKAEALYRSFVTAARALGLGVKEGVFQAHMKVSLINDGPVTLLLETGPAAA